MEQVAQAGLTGRSVPYRSAIPAYSLKGLTVLDVGCQTGKDLASAPFSGAEGLYGIDIDRAAVAQGIEKFPHLHLQVSPAEKLPFEDGKFDVVVSRVSLPYTDLPRSLAEIQRVLKPGGRVYVSMHSWWHQWTFFKNAAQRLALRRMLDHAYVLVASLIYNITGKCIPRHTGRRETFQTESRFRKSLRHAGFDDITVEHIDNKINRHWIFEAVKRI